MGLFSRITNLFRSRRLADEIDDELRFHIAERADELVERGLSREEARREAAVRFGSYASQREETREMNVALVLEAFLRDLRFGARQLRLNPGFTAVAVLSLALGIGANSAVFQLINAVKLRSLPVDDAAQLVAIDAQGDYFVAGGFAGRHQPFSYAQFEQVQLQQRAFTDMLAFSNTRFNLNAGGEAQYAEGLYVTPNFLAVLGVAPYVGAWISPTTDPRDCSNAGAVLSHSFWQRAFGGDRDAVGRDLLLNGRSFPILAVTPPSFRGLEPARRFDVALPLCAEAPLPSGGRLRVDQKSFFWLTQIGRLKPGWTVDRASAHLREVSPAVFDRSLPESYNPQSAEAFLANRLGAVSARAGVSSVRRQYENPLWILLATTGLVLLIACANLANLLLARASARDRETALRQAVGASRTRLFAQLMSESLLLAGLGAVLGGGLAHLLSRGLATFLSSGDPQLNLALGVDWRVLGFTAAAGLLTCLLFGAAPALRATKAAPARAVRGGRGAGGLAERPGLRSALVVTQIALSFVLLAGALLFGQSLRNLLGAETGMVSEGVLVATVNTEATGMEAGSRRTLFRELENRLSRLPGVASSAAAQFSPYGSGWMNRGVRTSGEETELAWFSRVGAGYFETLQTPLLAGREFDTRDGVESPETAIVNEEFARKFFGGDNPVGKTFRYRAGDQEPVCRIVGLVGNTKYQTLREEPKAIAFISLSQAETPRTALAFLIRADGPAGGVMSRVRAQLLELNGGLQVEFNLLDEQMRQTVLRERLVAHLSAGFGVLAALLSAMGLYGVISYIVARRTNEIGIRLALGARRADVGRLVLGQTTNLLLAGLALGVVATLALGRYAASLLYRLEPTDARTLTLSGLLLAAAALAAVAVPVRRAVKMQPAIVLRKD